MGRRSRLKGQAGEREARDWLRAHGVWCSDRLLGQERDGGFDLETALGPCEVKRRKSLTIEGWLKSARFVLARSDRGRWLVVLDAEEWARLVNRGE